MRIPFWIWILFGLTALSWIIPDGIPGEEFILPALAVGSLLLRRHFRRNFYQQQYQQYQQQGSKGGGASAGQSAQGAQGSGSFYNRFRPWGAGYQQGGQGTQTPSSGKDPHTVLGVQSGASLDEIKKAYREKLKKYHPDIVANLKLGDDYREMFEEKTREIQQAYEQLGGK
jgi:hypothetical protein